MVVKFKIVREGLPLLYGLVKEAPTEENVLKHLREQAGDASADFLVKIDEDIVILNQIALEVGII